jgi:hypothetical protein
MHVYQRRSEMKLPKKKKKNKNKKKGPEKHPLGFTGVGP